MSRSNTAQRKIGPIGYRLSSLIWFARKVTLIVGNTRSALAAKSATTTIPIVFVTGGRAA
jgi:hypothetical protein